MQWKILSGARKGGCSGKFFLARERESGRHDEIFFLWHKRERGRERLHFLFS